MKPLPSLLLVACLIILLLLTIQSFTKGRGPRPLGEPSGALSPAFGPADYIQFGILTVLGFTLFLALWQSWTQNKLYRAQLLRDRFEMYWKMYEPVSQGQGQELKEFPEDFIDLKVYEEKYKDHDRKLRKYIGMAKRYEYLAFAYGLKVLHLKDPLGHDWTQHWTRDLLKDEIFLDVHHYFGAYYPHYEKFIEGVLRQKKRVG